MKRVILFFALALSGLGAANAQWSSDPEENTQLSAESFYTWETGYCEDGSFYLFYDRPAGNDTSRIIPFLNYFDKDGNEIWPAPIQLADAPTLSYTKYMQHLLVDADGNAIVAVQNMENGRNETYTLYKLDRNGDFLWDENGIDLQENQDNFTVSPGALNFIQLEDGNYVFAWMDIVDNLFGEIMLQKITPDGERLWGTGKNIGDGDYPYLVDAGNGDIILVYAWGGIRARKLDFEGNDIWTEPVTVFDGSLPELIPLWTYIEVLPANGGALVGYYGFDGNTNRYPLISMIKNDGTHAFAEGKSGLRLGFSENWGFEPSLTYDEQSKSIYAIWRENKAGTNFVSRFVSQKVSEQGELLWNPEGVELLPMKERALGYATAQMGPEGKVLFGFMEHAGVGISANDPINVYAVLQNPNGSFAWESTTQIVSNEASCKYDLDCSPFMNNQWIFIWEDCRVEGGVDNGFVFGQNIRLDGSLGSSVSNERQKPLSNNVQILPNPAKDYIQITYFNTENQSKITKIELVDLQGRLADIIYQGDVHAGENRIEWQRPANLASGMYMLRIEIGNQSVSSKLMLL